MATLTDEQVNLLDRTDPVRQEVGLGQHVQDLEEAGTTAAADIDALEAADVVIEGDIVTLEGDVGDLQTDVGDLQNEDIALDGRLDTLELGPTSILRFPITHDDLTEASAGQEFVLGHLSATDLVRLIDSWIEVSEDFAGGSASAVTAEVGEDYTPDSNGLVLAQSVFTGVAPAPVGVAPADKGAQLEAGETSLLWPDENVTALITATDDNVNNLTTGELYVVFVFQKLGVPVIART